MGDFINMGDFNDQVQAIKLIGLINHLKPFQ